MDKITAGVLLSRDDSERDCSKSCFEPPGQLQANPDIGGLGVLISFMATAWLVVFLVMFRYCITFDPNSNPFHRPGKDTIRDQKKKWKPNTIDYKFTGMFKGLRGRLKNHGGWTAAINQILLNMGDAQIITGLGILVSSFINLNCYISAYHWQISTYLAWFSNLTHAACLSSLRGYLYERQMQRNFRMFFMAVLFVLLITAIVPTAYFNWEQRDSLPASSASFPASNTHCFFSRRIAHELWNGQFCSPSEGRRSSCRKPVITLSTTAAYESSVFSIILLGVGFIIRFVKMSRTLSDLGNNGFRERMDQWVMMSLDKLASGCQGLRVNGLGRWTLRILRPLDIMIALYLVGRLYTEILLSELAYLSWLFLASLWGSFRLYQARSSAKVEGSENEWQFGQILPVFLLLGPLLAFIIPIVEMKRNTATSRIREEDRKAIEQALEVIKVHQRETLRTRLEDSQGHMNALDRVAEILRDINQNSSNNPSNDRPERQQTEFGAFPIHQSRQSLQTYQISTPSARDQSSELHVGLENGIFPRLNQNIIMGAPSVDFKSSLDAYFNNSRWMVLMMWVQCIQLCSAVAVVILFLLVANLRGEVTATYRLGNIAIIATGMQPLSCLGGMIIGLYLDDQQFSMVLLALLSVIPQVALLLNVLVASVLPKMLLGISAAVSLVSVVFLFLEISFVRLWRLLLRTLRRSHIR